MNKPRIPVGDTLVSIQYELLNGEPDPSARNVIDAELMGITLTWRYAPPQRISWSLDGWEEGLVFGDPLTLHWNPAVEFVDVSTRWGFLIGDQLDGCRFSYAEPATARSSAGLPWAVNLSFVSRRHLVIALGEVELAGPAYMPDEILVTDSQDIAQRYFPRGAFSSAWGGDERRREP